jgi:hypothetical protein
MTDDILTDLLKPVDKMTHGILYLNEKLNDGILVFSYVFLKQRKLTTEVEGSVRLTSSLR